MSPLAAAREMRDSPPRNDGIWCIYCERQTKDLGPYTGEHAPDPKPAEPHEAWCAALALPRIVAALEAAERVVAAWQADNGHQRIGSGWAVDFDRGIAWVGEKREAEAALVAAMKGEEVTA